MPNILIQINGLEVAASPTQSVLEACRQHGIDIPTLCHDDRITPTGGCRLCMVEVENHSHLIPACNTRVEAGMRIHTHSDRVEQHRITLLQLLANSHPAACVPAPVETPFIRCLTQYSIQPIQDSTRSTAVAPGKMITATPQSLPHPSHPYLDVDMDRCITCFRCVRICDEVQGEGVWQAWDRGDRCHIRSSATNKPLLETSCVSCGACSDTCPTGAIQDSALLHGPPPTHWTKTVCPYCGTGCEMQVGTSLGKIRQIRPDTHSPVNRGHLCVKGRYAHDYVEAPDRILEPMLRNPDGTWRQVEWHEALDAVARAIRRAQHDGGPQATAMLSSARSTNEDNYVAQKFARLILGTHNIDSCARVCHAPTAAAMGQLLGTGAATNSFEDIEKCRCFLLVGCNPLESHPVVGARIRQAVRKGARLIVIDPRQTDLARIADIHLALRPGTNVPLLNALLHVLIQESLIPDSTPQLLGGAWDAFRHDLQEWTPERAAAICGLDPELIRRAAREYGQQHPAMCFHGLGVTEQTQGTDGVEILVQLALLTGQWGIPGAGVNPLRGQNNVQGAAHMGCEPHRLPGFVPVDQGRHTFEQLWKRPLPILPGLDLPEMLEAAQSRKLHLLWIMGYDIAQSHSCLEETFLALQKIPCIIVQDLFLNEVAQRYAHVFLPACSSFEKEGTFMNSERRVQRVRACIPPRGTSQPDWQILRNVAIHLGESALFPYSQAAEIWDEIRQAWPAGRGITWDRLEHQGLQWPCPDIHHPGTAILHTEHLLPPSFHLKAITYRPTPEKTSTEFPLLLTTGRNLHHYNSGTMTRRSGNQQLRPEDRLDLSPDDAQRLDLRDNDPVKVHSRHGNARLKVHVDPSITPGQCFATFHQNQSLLNQLTSPHRDSVTHTPEFKVVAVRLEPLPPSPSTAPSPFTSPLTP